MSAGKILIAQKRERMQLPSCKKEMSLSLLFWILLFFPSWSGVGWVFGESLRREQKTKESMVENTSDRDEVLKHPEKSFEPKTLGSFLWSNNYHLYSSSVESPVDGFAYFGQTIFESHLISPGLQLYYEGYFPYASYMALFTRSTLPDNPSSEQSAEQLEAPQNPFRANSSVNSDLQDRNYKFVLLHEGTQPYDPDPVYLKNQFYFAPNGRDTTLWYIVYDAFRYIPSGLPSLPSFAPLPFLTRVATSLEEMISFSNTSKPFFQSLIRQGLYPDTFSDPACPSLFGPFCFLSLVH